MVWAIPLAAIVGYLIGSIPVGLIVGRLTRGIDVRDYGSGVTGATNVIRTSGVKAGVVVIIGDIAKGIVPVYLGLAIASVAEIDGTDDRAWVAAAGGFAAVVGHIWPVFADFRGGRAVATGFGAALAMNPLASAAMIPVAALVVGATRIMSVMSITMAPALAVLFIVLAALDVSPWAYAAYASGAAALIVWKHRPNIERLIAGTEPKIGRGGDKRAQPDEERAPSPS
jgi:glycerol-3-phosphate acyltransferase PlsY